MSVMFPMWLVDPGVVTQREELMWNYKCVKSGLTVNLNSRTQATLALKGEFYKEGMVCAEGQGSNEFYIFQEKKEDNRAVEREV